MDTLGGIRRRSFGRWLFGIRQSSPNYLRKATTHKTQFHIENQENRLTSTCNFEASPIVMETACIDQVLRLFEMLSKADQLKIAEQINEQTFKQRWRLTDKQLPDISISEEEIMDEVRAIRSIRR